MSERFYHCAKDQGIALLIDKERRSPEAVLSLARNIRSACEEIMGKDDCLSGCEIKQLITTLAKTQTTTIPA